MRNILSFKLIRLYRIGAHFIPEKNVADMLMSCYEPNSRDEKIAHERKISVVIQTINQIMQLVQATCIIGLLWYRMSDHLLPMLTRKIEFANEPDERYWVVVHGLRRPECEAHLDADDPILQV